MSEAKKILELIKNLEELKEKAGEAKGVMKEIQQVFISKGFSSFKAAHKGVEKKREKLNSRIKEVEERIEELKEEVESLC